MKNGVFSDRKCRAF